MKYADINKRYTEIVAEYMGKGYAINTATMNGSQSEVAKIDLTDGNDIIRIIIDTFSDWKAGTDGIEIIVGKATDNVKPNDNRTWYTIWNGHLETIRVERFYNIAHNADYYVTEDEAKKANEIRNERSAIRYSSDKGQFTPSERAIEIAKKIIKRKFGYVRVNTSEVKIAKDREGYVVRYNQKSYRLR